MKQICSISILAAAFVLSSCAHATSTLRPVHLPQPEGDAGFLVLADGTDLRKIEVQKKPLTLAFGTGAEFTSMHRRQYDKLKRETQNDALAPVQWTLMDLDQRRVLQKSAGSDRKIFGASNSKVFVAGALLEKQNGKLTAEQLQQMSAMLVVSSNVAWVALQNQIGDGDDDRGREAIHAFTQRMGYQKTRGFQGMLGLVHGNELTADETARFLQDTYWSGFPGAETLWKLMHTCRTGVDRALKFLPKDQIVGGKTGTYRGESVDPDTGLEILPDGSKYRVHVMSHLIVFNLHGREYALVILANTGTNDSAALLAGGLYRELLRP